MTEFSFEPCTSIFLKAQPVYFNTSMYLVDILSSLIYRHIVNPFTNPPVQAMVSCEVAGISIVLATFNRLLGGGHLLLTRNFRNVSYRVKF